MFARHKLRFLDDPQGVFGGTERIHAVARWGLQNEKLKITNFLSRLHLPKEHLDIILLQAQNNDPENAVNTYLQENQKRIEYWITGKI